MNFWTGICLMVFLCFFPSIQAQVGTPNNGIQFSTSTGGSTVGPLGQLQAGTFGDINGAGSNWAALGAAPFPTTGPVPYGLRLQKNGQFGLFNLVGSFGNEDLIVGFGQNVGSAFRVRYISNQLSGNPFTAFKDVLTATGAGNVGIGTSNPLSALNINLGSTRNSIRVTSNGNASAYSDYIFDVADQSPVASNRVADWVISHRKDGYFSGGTAGSGGGTTLEFYGVRNKIDPFLPTQYYAPLVFKGNGDVIISSDQSIRQGNTTAGRVAVRTTNTTNEDFFVNGTTGCTGGVWNSSDRRFKRNIQTVEGALDKIMALNGVTYSYNTKKFGTTADFSEVDPGTVMYGFIAQEVEKIAPELTHVGEEGYYAVNYDGVTPILVEAVKEQQATIELLRQELEALKQQLSETPQTQPNQTPTIRGELLNQIKLDQNRPNPSSYETTIGYYIPNEIEQAALVIFDMSGKILERRPVQTGKGNVNINVQGMEAGTYTYSLLINNQIVMTKRMIVE
ncbi:MAG: tail fiber domain-containing protein [Bacteroidota bacterium]